MFYRRKVILALLEQFGGKLEKINLYKLLFIFTKFQQKPEYDFIPYKFGCYSYSLNADLVTMFKKNQLKDNDIAVEKIGNKNYLNTLSEADKRLMISVYNQFKNFSGDALMYYTYTKYPYTAINSVKAKSLLSTGEFEKVLAQKPDSTKSILYTIGYEGISLEEYLNRLIKHDVRVLVDVRNNALSQKYGFSKSLLQKFCLNLNIQYFHFPDVGIQAKFRHKLNVQDDYDTLFKYYKLETIPETLSTQERIVDLLINNKRVALTCFEANICQCHRKHLAEAITTLPRWKFELKHI